MWATNNMQEYKILKMNDFSNHQISRVRMLEQLCKDFDGSSLRVGIESLKENGGDKAFLCQMGNQLIGYLSWYTSDEIEANINAMVHPDYRRQGVFRSLMNKAAAEMQIQGIKTCRIRIPSNSKPGIDCVKHLGANFNTSEFTMHLVQFRSDMLHHSGLVLRLEEAQDFDFMVKCSSQAFGDSESWTRNYFKHTREPERVTYLAVDRLTPVGMVRVNHVHTDTAVIHDFCVHPLYQGRGYGREILARVVNILLAKQYTQIRLGVVTQNKRALNLYRSIGFEISAESHYYVSAIHHFND
ncbi:GNAT family N-acetyltransferase [Paenibacillus jamilae]|nr:GNAT family N-acetyltransferase [Paenibacillus jamilae]AUO05316.1 N-acetyltransferase [Paenibacillus sp. lzh-N1]